MVGEILRFVMQLLLNSVLKLHSASWDTYHKHVNNGILASRTELLALAFKVNRMKKNQETN